jgi:5'-nucleotidase
MSVIQRVVAVNVAQGPTIMLASGRRFDFLNPHGSDFDIEDIAHGLAHICRYSGQCRAFYSVAEHSILVADTAEDFAYEALLHDAAEAFIGDVTRPFKQILPEYKRIEAAVEDAIIERFGMDRRFKDIVKRADLRVLAAEQAQVLMAPGCADWAAEAGINPAPIQVRYLDPKAAKRGFLARFEKCRNERRINRAE